MGEEEYTLKTFLCRKKYIFFSQKKELEEKR